MTSCHIADVRQHEIKTCSKCGETLPLERFSRDSASRDGLRPDCKACRSAVGKAHYQESRERILAHQKRRYAEDPERVRSYYRRYYAENKSGVLSKNKVWKRENWDRYSKQQKQYTEANRERANARCRAWAKRHPERARAARQAHYAKRRAVLKSGVTMAEILQWLDQQAPFCFYCRADCSDGKFHIDHFHPLARGGAHELDNLRIACQPCNSRKSARDPYEFMASLST